MITPNDLNDFYSREDIKRELIELEKTIDDHLYNFYTVRNCEMPGIELEKLKEPIEKILVSIYDRYGWTISFKPLEDKNKYLLFIKEKEEHDVIISDKKFKQSFRIKE